MVPNPTFTRKYRSWRRRLIRVSSWGCGTIIVLLLVLVGTLFLILNPIPGGYPIITNPIEPPAPAHYAAFDLDGFESPYLGHTGSWDGKGGAMFGGSKRSDLDKEVAMGLRWTFMPVHWRAMEPDGSVNPSQQVPDAWRELDGFVIEAQRRKLNILMQVVIGGNAGGPPDWAGRREPGKSAPADMAAAAAFAGKLAARYAPRGVLATDRGWAARFGVRAWELDNEPESYRTCWKDQAGDYAEFATLATEQIKSADGKAMILLPAVAGGGNANSWVQAALGANPTDGSPTYRHRGRAFSIGPIAGGVSFHTYEGLETAFSRTDRTIENDFGDLRDLFEKSESRVSRLTYVRKREYWHTEGNFDFIGLFSAPRRAAWQIQFFTRAFAAGIRKVCVMDPSAPEQAAVKAYVATLPWPFPMRPADAEVKVLHGAAAFRHLDGKDPDAGQVWVIWAIAGTGEAKVELPVIRGNLILINVDGAKSDVSASGGHVAINLQGDAKMAPPILVVDRQSSQ